MAVTTQITLVKIILALYFLFFIYITQTSRCLLGNSDGDSWHHKFLIARRRRHDVERRRRRQRRRRRRRQRRAIAGRVEKWVKLKSVSREVKTVSSSGSSLSSSSSSTSMKRKIWNKVAQS